MTKQELCKMCDEWSINNKCEYEDNCKLLKILKENEYLKRRVAELEHKIESDRCWDLYGDMNK